MKCTYLSVIKIAWISNPHTFPVLQLFQPSEGTHDNCRVQGHGHRTLFFAAFVGSAFLIYRLCYYVISKVLLVLKVLS